jgi:hypothetical protein
MKLSDRERLIVAGLIVALLAFALDRLVLGPYLDWRGQLTAQAAANNRSLAEAHQMLDRERDLRRLLASMGGTIASDASTAEGQLLQLVHDREQEAGVGNASFSRVRTAEQHGYTCLTFHVSASGPMSAVAMLLYRLESTPPIPLRIEDVTMAPAHESADEVSVHLNVSTLYRPKSRTGTVITKAVAALGAQ